MITHQDHNATLEWGESGKMAAFSEH